MTLEIVGPPFDDPVGPLVRYGVVRFIVIPITMCPLRSRLSLYSQHSWNYLPPAVAVGTWCSLCIVTPPPSRGTIGHILCPCWYLLFWYPHLPGLILQFVLLFAIIITTPVQHNLPHNYYYYFYFANVEVYKN